MSQELTDVDYERIKVDDPTLKAVLFVINRKEVWLPRSQIEVDTDDKTITMPEWLALDKGLI